MKQIQLKDETKVFKTCMDCNQRRPFPGHRQCLHTGKKVPLDGIREDCPLQDYEEPTFYLALHEVLLSGSDGTDLVAYVAEDGNVTEFCTEQGITQEQITTSKDWQLTLLDWLNAKAKSQKILDSASAQNPIDKA